MKKVNIKIRVKEDYIKIKSGRTWSVYSGGWTVDEAVKDFVKNLLKIA